MPCPLESLTNSRNSLPQAFYKTGGTFGFVDRFASFHNNINFGPLRLISDSEALKTLQGYNEEEGGLKLGKGLSFVDKSLALLFGADGIFQSRDGETQQGLNEIFKEELHLKEKDTSIIEAVVDEAVYKMVNGLVGKDGDEIAGKRYLIDDFHKTLIDTTLSFILHRHLYYYPNAEIIRNISELVTTCLDGIPNLAWKHKFFEKGKEISIPRHVQESSEVLRSGFEYVAHDLKLYQTFFDLLKKQRLEVEWNPSIYLQLKNLTESQEEKWKGFDRRLLIDNLISLTIAGHETTAILLLDVLWRASAFPDKEILELIQDSLFENPPIPLIFRTANNQDVVISLQSINRKQRKKWTEKGNGSKRLFGYAFGMEDHRKCPGRNLALKEVQELFKRFNRYFHYEFQQDKIPWGTETTKRPYLPVPCILTVKDEEAVRLACTRHLERINILKNLKKLKFNVVRKGFFSEEDLSFLEKLPQWGIYFPLRVKSESKS